MTGKALKFLLSLFTLNSISLYLYFSSSSSSSSSTTTHRLPPPEYQYSPPEYSPSAKPWPTLPSYLPWTQNKATSFRSCEAFFGNGFTERVDPLKPASENRRKIPGWFRCFYSATLRSSVCEGGGIRMDPERIFMSRGGEKLDSVIGREEDEEMPVFGDGAFRIQVDDRSRVGEKMVDLDFLDEYVPQGGVEKHTMRGLIGSIQLVDESEFDCSQWIEEPTILVTRFEYANVFHTFTDWYSAYVASRVAALPYRPHLVFVDGHCETGLEETWRALFSSLNYAKNFSGPVCFRHAILAPLGYETPLFKGLSENIDCHGTSAQDLQKNPDHRKTARLSEFGEMIRASLGIPLDKNIPDPASGRNILFVRREDYRPHPRHGGKIQTRLSNEQEVFDSINTWAPNHMACKLNVVNGLFAHMSMKEQVQAIKDASVIVGAHGAGLTHIVSANPGTVILEIISSEYRRPHFQLIAMWKGLEYHAIHLYGSHANPKMVLERLERILGNLGC